MSEHSEEGGYRRGVCQALLAASRWVEDMREGGIVDLSDVAVGLRYYADIAYAWRYSCHEPRVQLLDEIRAGRRP